MATRQNRMAEFNMGEPPVEEPLEILCEDHCGTYVIPFLCRWMNGEWKGIPSNHPVQVVVLGWRRP
jgi:hypothetical protein